MNDQQSDSSSPNVPLPVGGLGIRQMMALSFRGRRRWMSVLAWVYSLGWFAVAVVAAVMFFRADTVRAMIAWAAVFVTTMMFVAVIKLWYWVIMQTAVTQDALARLEASSRQGQ